MLVYFGVDGVSLATVTASEALPGTIIARLGAAFRASRGDAVNLAVRHERMQLFDPETGESLTPAS